MVTELGTALGMLGHDDVDLAIASRSPVMRSLSPDDWDQLQVVRSGGAYNADFHAAWANGQAFLAARDGLRGRRPEIVEWKGSIRAAGDEVAPVDLRIDHVYLVSCKYLSNILFNVSPTHLFDSLLVGGTGRRGKGAGGDWYAELAPAEYQHLYEAVRAAVLDEGEGGGVAPLPMDVARRAGGDRSPALPGLEPGAASAPAAARVATHSAATLRELPHRAVDLTPAHRSALGNRLKAGWPGRTKEAYGALSGTVARQSAGRWHQALSAGPGAGEAMLWRLLRMGSAPYFVLGSSATQSLRLRIATPWDWRQQYALGALEVFAQDGGQPRVGWRASVRERASGTVVDLAGHVEVRWSHGRFGGLPEAKGYLDTPHHLVPGYFALQ
jgi:hypothetical protein